MTETKIILCELTERDTVWCHIASIMYELTEKDSYYMNQQRERKINIILQVDLAVAKNEMTKTDVTLKADLAVAKSKIYCCHLGLFF